MPIGADRAGGHPGRRAAVLIRDTALEDGAFGPVLFLRLQNQIDTPAPVRRPRAAPGISKYLRIQSGANKR